MEAAPGHIFVECQALGCASVLQVVVPSSHRQGDGGVLVRCGKCNRLLRVQLPPELLGTPPDTAAAMLEQPAQVLTYFDATSSLAAPPYQQHTPSDWQQTGISGGGFDMQQLFHAPPYPQPAFQQPSAFGVPPHVAQVPAQATGSAVVRRRRAPSAYNEFISRELKRLKTEQGLDHKAAFKLAAGNWVASGAKAAAAAQQQARDGLHLALAEGAYMSQLQQLLQEQAAQQGYYTTTEPLLLPMPTPTTTLPAAAAQQVGDMPPPAARASISGSDAANNQQPLAGTAAAPAPTAAANVSQEASAVPVSGTGGLTDSGSGQIASTVGAVLNSASSTQHYVQHTTTAVPGGMTLQQAWESLCRSKQGGGVETVVLAAGCYDASTADYSAAAHDSTTAAAPAGAARLPSPAEEGTASGEPGCAAQQGTSVLGGHTAAAAGGGRVTTNSLTAPSQAPLSTAAGHKEPVGHVAVPIGTTAAGAVAVDPAAAALIVSEGSSLASVSSVMTGGAGERVGVTVASPGNNSVSGAAASTAPSILRHRSAPITTGCHRGAGGGGG